MRKTTKPEIGEQGRGRDGQQRAAAQAEGGGAEGDRQHQQGGQPVPGDLAREGDDGRRVDEGGAGRGHVPAPVGAELGAQQPGEAEEGEARGERVELPAEPRDIGDREERHSQEAGRGQGGEEPPGLPRRRHRVEEADQEGGQGPEPRGRRVGTHQPVEGDGAGRDGQGEADPPAGVREGRAEAGAGQPGAQGVVGGAEAQQEIGGQGVSQVQPAGGEAVEHGEAGPGVRPPAGEGVGLAAGLQDGEADPAGGDRDQAGVLPRRIGGRHQEGGGEAEGRADLDDQGQVPQRAIRREERPDAGAPGEADQGQGGQQGQAVAKNLQGQEPRSAVLDQHGELKQRQQGEAGRHQGAAHMPPDLPAGDDLHGHQHEGERQRLGPAKTRQAATVRRRQNR